MNKILQFKKWSQPLCLFSGLWVLVLSGCQTLPTQPADEPAPTLVEAEQPQVGLSTRQVHELMVAELLVQRQQFMPAFGLIYKVAVESPQPELAARAFEVAMQTMKMEAIRSATYLWKQRDEKAVEAWRASYLLCVLDGEVAQAISEWQTYQTLSGEGLEEAILSSTLRVTQAVPAERGMAFLQALSKKYDDLPAMAYGLGVAANYYELPEQAIAALLKARKLYAQAKQQLLEAQVNSTLEQARQLRNIDKVNEDIHLKLASAYLLQGDYEVGLAQLADYANPINQDNLDDLFQLTYAQLELKAQRYEDAEKRFEWILAHDPDKHFARFSLALIKLEKKDFPQADKHLLILTQKSNYQTVAYYYYGVSLQEQMQYDQARKAFESISVGRYWVDAQLRLAELDGEQYTLQMALTRLNKLVPQLKDTQDIAPLRKVHKAIGLAYQQMGDYANSIASYQSALDLEPNSVELLLLQAMVMYELKQYPQYEANLNRALVLDANNIDALNALGYHYAELGTHLVEAQQLLNRALALAPNEFYVLDSIGWLAYKKQEYALAERYLEQALAQKMDAEVLYHLFQVKLKLTKYNDIQSLWQQYQAQFEQTDAHAKLSAFVAKALSQTPIK